MANKNKKKCLKLEEKIRDFCLSRDIGFSFSWTHVLDFTVEIDDKYGSIPDRTFFAQSVFRKKALKETWSWLKKQEKSK